MQHDLSNVDWTHILEQRDVNVCMESFMAVLKGVINRYAPEQIITNIKDKSWINQTIRSLSETKRQLYYDTRRGWSSPEVYKSFMKEYRVQIAKAKADFYTRQIRNSSNINKTTWNIINKISGKTVSTFDIEQLRQDPMENSKSIADRINLFYIESCTNIAPLSEIKYQVRNNPNTMVLRYTEPVELYNVMNGLKNTSATGPDGIPVGVVKFCASILAAPLSEIVNRAFDGGIFPDQLRLANIIPVFKKGDKRDISIYRPIALSSVLAKVFEKVILSRIMSILRGFDLIAGEQNAYLEGRSTTRAIYQVLSRIIEQLNAGVKCRGDFLRSV